MYETQGLFKSKTLKKTKTICIKIFIYQLAFHFRRRYEREKIGDGGAPECWGNSPEHAVHSE